MGVKFSPCQAAVAEFGCAPPASNPYSSAMTAVDEHLRVVHQETITKATQFLRAFRMNALTADQRQWAAQMRKRKYIAATSSFGRALAASKESGVRKVIAMGGLNLESDATMDLTGPLAVVQEAFPVGTVSFIPQAAADFLYQLLAEVVMASHAVLGRGAFDEIGQFRAPDGSIVSGGQLAVVWGTELGARREQSMLAYDYDLDIAVFLTPDISPSSFYVQLQGVLQSLPLHFVEYNRDGHAKFRI